MADEAYHSGELSSYRAVHPQSKELQLGSAESRKRSPKSVDSPSSDYASGPLPSITESEGYASMTMPSLPRTEEEEEGGEGRSISPCAVQEDGGEGRSISPYTVPPVAENVEVVADSEIPLLMSPQETLKRKGPDDSPTSKGGMGVIRVPTIVSANPSPKRRHVGSPECLDDPVAMALTSNSPAPDMTVVRAARTAARVNFESVSELSKSDRPKLRAASEERERRSLQRSPAASPLPAADRLLSRGGEDEKKEGKQSALLQVSEAHLAILPDEDGDTPLHLSVIHENISLTKYLVQLIVGVYLNLDIANNMRQTPLHLAVITRQPQMVQLLITSGSSVNFPDRRGNTSLHLASERRDVRILQLLATASSPVPNFNCKNFSGVTAVHVAAKEASIDVLKFLFQNGANKNAQDACSGRTALHYAVEAENFTLANYLLESGCNVNAATFAGNTPLHIAAGRRLKELVALLMAYGANPAIANGEGDFPSDLPASLLMQRAKMNAN